MAAYKRIILKLSGEALSNKTSDIYEKCDAVVRKMTAKVLKEMDDKEETDDVNADYIVDEKRGSAVLTPRGIKKVEAHFGIENLNDSENAVIAHNVNQSVHAWGVKKREVDYVIVDGEVIIVDPHTGRLMHGRRYQDGLHQAIEAKERVNIKGESRVTATVTIQNYFRNAVGRKEVGLSQNPTDVELEVLAQTWSEHCKHKIFSAVIDYENAETGEKETIDSCYKSFVKKSTKNLAVFRAFLLPQFSS